MGPLTQQEEDRQQKKQLQVIMTFVIVTDILSTNGIILLNSKVN